MENERVRRPTSRDLHTIQGMKSSWINTADSVDPETEYDPLDVYRRYQNERTRRLTDAVGEIKDFFEESKETFTDEDAKMVMSAPPKLSDFPTFIFFVSLVKDILDIPLELSVIGIIVTTLLSAIIYVILFFWSLGKLSGGWWKKRLIKKLWRRFIICGVIEFLLPVPWIKMIPANVIFTLMTHYSETKLVKMLNLALEKIRAAEGGWFFNLKQEADRAKI